MLKREDIVIGTIFCDSERSDWIIISIDKEFHQVDTECIARYKTSSCFIGQKCERSVSNLTGVDYITLKTENIPAIPTQLTIQLKVCTCSEDHIHNERGCITGMCSCRIQPPKLEKLEDKYHNFDKYCKRPIRNDNGQIIRYLSYCINCGKGINISNKICIPNPEWRILQEKQFSLYMEESDKVKKMNRK